jgi:hypothetical protein
MIADDTPIIPEILADAVAGDFPAEIRNELSDHLSKRANLVYQHSPRWAQKIRGQAGRDFLYEFMEHWAKAWWQRRKFPNGSREL